MKRILVSYANEKYIPAQKKLIKSAKKINYFDEIYSFGPSDIEKSYVDKHTDIFSVERGNGLWLWKPYFIKKVLDSASMGDIIFYCDSGAFFIKNPRKLEKVFSDVFVSEIPLIERKITKKETLDYFECDDIIRNSRQIIATYMIIRKTEKSMKIINEWKLACESFDLISPSKDKKLEIDDFISHREDQSLLSIICKKNNIPALPDITHRVYLQYTYFGVNYIFKRTNKRAGVYLFLHKLPNPKFSSLLKLCYHQISYHLKISIRLILRREHCEK